MGSIHERLRKFRLKAGLTLQQVSDRTGIPVSTYKEWENGRQIRGEPYLLLARVYQVSLQELITGEKTQLGPVLEKLDSMIGEIEAVKRDLVSFF